MIRARDLFEELSRYRIRVATMCTPLDNSDEHTVPVMILCLRLTQTHRSVGSDIAKYSICKQEMLLNDSHRKKNCLTLNFEIKYLDFIR